MGYFKGSLFKGYKLVTKKTRHAGDRRIPVLLVFLLLSELLSHGVGKRSVNVSIHENRTPNYRIA